MTARKWLSLAVIATFTLVLGSASTSNAASHREAPGILNDPLADNTDVYAFTSPDDPDTVTLIANWIPFEEPQGGPNFYPFGENIQYDINIDNNADAVPDITYRWEFTSSRADPDSILYNNGPVNSFNDETLNFRQTYTLSVIRDGTPTVLLSDAVVAPSNVGRASMPNYEALREEAIVPFADEGGAVPFDNGLSFAGQADDPFFLDLRVFDLLYGGDLSEIADDSLDGYNINAVAIQVPKTALAAGGDAEGSPIIGVYSTTSRPSTEVRNPDGTKTVSGDPVQISRLGNPLVNELIPPLGPARDLFNSSKPADDAQFLSLVQDPQLPKVIEQVYGIPAPPAPRDDLVSVFLTGVPELNMPEGGTPSEMLRLNMSTPVTADPERLGVLAGDNQGFPNGRRLVDDVVDIELQVVMGELVGSPNDLTDAVDMNDKPFLDTFPYLALPHSGSQVRTSTDAGASPAGGVDTGIADTRRPAGSDGPSVPVIPMAVLAAGATLAGVGIARSKRAASAKA